MAMTLQMRYAKALEARGETRLVSTSNRFLRYSRKEGGFYFLGKAGSLRIGQSKTASNPVRDSFKKQLVGEVK